MRPGVMRRPKPSSEAEQQYKADAALAGRRAELLDAAREAEARFREAQARRAPDAEVRRRAPASGPSAACTTGPHRGRRSIAWTVASRADPALQAPEGGPRVIKFRGF